MRRLLEQIRSEADRHKGLLELVAACERVASHMSAAPAEDRLAGSYPFLSMLAMAVSGWLMERQNFEAESELEDDGPFKMMKVAATGFYLNQIVPEALGYEDAAVAPSSLLYSVSEEALSAA
jgi:hypothetical protein